MLRKSLRISLIFVLPVVAALVLTSMAFAHGSLLTPISRAFNCYLENPESPDSLPCQEVVNMSGTQPLYDWNEVNLSQGGENSRLLIPDGHLCSAGRTKYYGYDQGRADWPLTTLPAAGSPYTFQLAVSANHPIATFTFYVTKDGYNPNVPLKWSDLEDQPFLVVDNPTLDAVAGISYPVYQFNTNLPNKTGRHLIYTMWVRHDSLENFYMCTDVWFGASAQPTATPAPACTAPAWVSGGFGYQTGDVVSHNNKEWIAKWGNSSEPSTVDSSAPWKIRANCTTGGTLPTNTAAPATATKTNTPVVVISPTITKTNTPVAVTATKTNTPAAVTATKTNTPVVNTPTRTPTTGPTATKTNTPVAGGTCSPVSATITTGFVKDGSGTFCWQASTLGSYINSWNTTSVSINGTNITNLYVASGSYPAKIGGFWYISYNSSVAWGHFETK